jgi:Tfp pilus assembly protein PilO
MPPFSNVLQGKPNYYGLIIGIVLFAACVGLVHYFLVIDLDSQIASAQSELDELQKKIEQGRAAEKKLPQFREEVRRLEQELDKLRRILPSTRNTEEIIKKIKSLVDQGNLDLKNLSFPDPVPSADSEVYADWNINVTVEGTYHNLAIFFDKLSNYPRIMNVDKFSINALTIQKSDKTITADFVTRTFMYIEKEDGGAATEGTDATKPGGAK